MRKTTGKAPLSASHHVSASPTTNKPSRSSEHAPTPSPELSCDEIVDLLARKVWVSDDPDQVASDIYTAVHFFRSAEGVSPYAEELSQIGAQIVAIGIMHRFPSHPKIQKGCCHLLILMLRHGLVQHPVNLERIGGIEAALRALDRFHDDLVVQINACFLLDELFSRNENVNEPTNYIRFLNNDGIAVLTAAMARHPTVERLQHSACHIIRLVGGSSIEICRLFLDAGCIGHVAIAIQTFEDNNRLQHAAHDAMQVLMNCHRKLRQNKHSHHRDEVDEEETAEERREDVDAAYSEKY